ncbi:aldo/keto reductase [candidate division KSB1 bacterium]|nr:aldo/keto reductase [candidate division KSB1 bacterium]
MIPKRHYKSGVEVSIIGFGGIVVVGMEQKAANEFVTMSIEKGVNYFDVAPTYGNGEAEAKLGIALESFREKVFLACKTTERHASEAQKELHQSLKRLHTDHFDLYQFHGVSSMEDVEKICAPNGAAEVFMKAKQEGKVRFLGFSAHSEQAALAMLDHFDFDSVLYPINFVCYAQGNFGQQLIRRAKEKDVTLLAIKSMAYTPFPEGAIKKYPNCWYLPIDDPALAKQALRFTLDAGASTIIPPGDPRLFSLALDLAADLKPLSSHEREELLASSRGIQPIFKA